MVQSVICVLSNVTGSFASVKRGAESRAWAVHETTLRERCSSIKMSRVDGQTACHTRQRSRKLVYAFIVIRWKRCHSRMRSSSRSVERVSLGVCC